MKGIRNQKMKKYRLSSKIADITIFQKDQNIHKIEFDNKDDFKNDDSKLLLKSALEIQSFLVGKLRNFTFSYIIEGTEFTKAVLVAMKSIPYGETRSYKELAIMSGYPLAYRAVGTVCKNNKLPILFPCHRVIKSNREYGDYSGGKDFKKFLVELENIY